ncbi:prephenate dehydratase [archaeon]|jgi:prephenate dehydratase|nr:prephenate dehydratase [archaeon]MBT4351401.1 prephenate dehydratase [archaeon]MBT4648196.1 prephenate dehydratase [archaeon]MBT6822246.1 prephenate dehydratase [archaeon]MBT7392620.1 prephenate dehydratase [archaeon]
MKIGLLGPAGTFTETALNKYNKIAKKVFLKSHFDVFDAVNNGLVDNGIIAIENQINGFVLANIDLFLNTNMNIIQEIIIPIHHCLAIPIGCKKIKNIISHPQALAQCQDYIIKKYPGARKIPSESTARGMEETKIISNSAGIGPTLAAEMNDLNIIDKNIEDYKKNETRFFIITKKKTINNKGKKTSIVFICKHEPGSLYNSLKVFAKNKVNLLNIFSRPIKNKSWEYSFYIELEGNVNGKKIIESIKKLKDQSLKVNILGSY